MKPIAILGGTFDPVHLGHLRVAWEAAETLGTQVRLMPAHVPPHRPAPVADAALRARMLELALASQDRLVLDTRELRRKGPSYSVDTLRDLRAEMPGSQPLLMLLGADAFSGIMSWRDWITLFDLAHFVVLTRPGHNDPLPGELAQEVATRRVSATAALQLAPAGSVLYLPVTPLEISASAVRALIARGCDPRWLLPEAVSAQPHLLDVYRTRAGPVTGVP